MTTLAKAKVEDERLILEMKKKNNEIEKLRVGHTAKTPSIYIQNSHSEQTWDCLKVPKNTLLILLGASGTSSMAGHEIVLKNEEVIKLLKQPINITPAKPEIGLEQMNEKLNKLTRIIPNITFHYSNYFGIKQVSDDYRQLFKKYKTTESYYDLRYSEPAIFPDEDNIPIRKMGLTTLDQLQKYVDIDKEPIPLEFYNSLDVLPYNTFQKINHIKNPKYSVYELKKYIPYFDVRNHSLDCPWREWYLLDPLECEYCEYPAEPCIGCPDFDTIQALYKDHELQYNTRNKGNPEALEKRFYENLKLSEIMKATGPGIYIHYACRPSEHLYGEPNTYLSEENEQTRYHNRFLRKNSQNTLRAAGVEFERDYTATADINGEIIGKFNNCEWLEYVTIAENVTKIDREAFASCIKLKTVTFLGNNLKFLGNKTFKNCEELKEIVLPNNIDYLGEFVFEGCRSLEKVTLPNNLKLNHEIKTQTLRPPALSDEPSDRTVSLERGLFKGCSNLKDVIFPEALAEIKTEVFKKTGLPRLNLSSLQKLKYIGVHTFSECKTLTEITLPNTVKELGHCAFMSCPELVKVTLSNNIKVIKVWTFKDCKCLAHINIPEKLEEINEEAFKDCKLLTTLVFPDEVKIVTIDPTAFSGCDNLKTVSVFKDTEIKINGIIINNSVYEFSLGSKSVRLECRAELTNPVTVEGIDMKPKISKTKPNRRKKNKRSKTKPNRRKKNKKNKKNSKRSKKNKKKSKR